MTFKPCEDDFRARSAAKALTLCKGLPVALVVLRRLLLPLMGSTASYLISTIAIIWYAGQAGQAVFFEFARLCLRAKSADA